MAKIKKWLTHRKIYIGCFAVSLLLIFMEELISSAISYLFLDIRDYDDIMHASEIGQSVSWLVSTGLLAACTSWYTRKLKHKYSLPLSIAVIIPLLNMAIPLFLIFSYGYDDTKEKALLHKKHLKEDAVTLEANNNQLKRKAIKFKTKSELESANPIIYLLYVFIATFGQPAYFMPVWYKLAKDVGNNSAAVNPLLFSLALIVIMILRYQIYKFFVKKNRTKVSPAQIYDKFLRNHIIQIPSVFLFFFYLMPIEGNVMGFVVLPITILLAMVCSTIVLAKNFSDML